VNQWNRHYCNEEYVLEKKLKTPGEGRAAVCDATGRPARSVKRVGKKRSRATEVLDSIRMVGPASARVG
jgi:hypothetical protein